MERGDGNYDTWRETDSAIFKNRRLVLRVLIDFLQLSRDLSFRSAARFSFSCSKLFEPISDLREHTISWQPLLKYIQTHLSFTSPHILKTLSRYVEHKNYTIMRSHLQTKHTAAFEHPVVKLPGTVNRGVLFK